ncbi:hypothetical protein XELAEV_18038138mg [Xenopus laevis]|uniref:Uncharacterized protein n=1 Tax=Xenopus laevis TaxID=8355 RepID=A0A974H6R1_XENLA|nr:hypothetical protein XELAEV_18038138mg [Xenopus laevis]
MVAPSWETNEKKVPRPEIKCLPVTETRCHQTNAPKQGLGQKVGSGMKRLFQCPQVEEVFIIQTQEAGKSPGVSNRKKLLFALGVFIMLLVVVLLLLWNYKCTIIDRQCQGNSELLTPLFQDN